MIFDPYETNNSALSQMMEMVRKEINNTKYTAFFAWLIQGMKDQKRKEARLAMLDKIEDNSLDMESILRTTIFPIPPKLYHLFAMLYNADRKIAAERFSTKGLST